MSLVTYNGVVLPYAFTTRFDQEAVYDESSTDWHLVKFDVEVQTLVNAAYLNLLAPDLAGQTTNPADVMNTIRQRLLRPRRPLAVKVNGVDLIPQVQAGLPAPVAGGGQVDAKNGPQPQRCTVTQMTAQTFLLTFHVIAHYWEGDQGGAELHTGGETDDDGDDLPVIQPPDPAGNAVLYNRWSESVDVDQAGYSVRVRDGRFVIRSDNNLGKIPDQLRSQMAVLGIPDGFLRTASRYTVDPSGLAFTYSHTDREVFKQPPFPASEADGTYSETFSKVGVVRTCEAWVKLKGAKGVSQARLMYQAIACCARKLKINGAALVPTQQQKVAGILEQGYIALGMFDNWVECRLRVKAPVADSANQGARTEGVAMQWKNLVATPTSDGKTQGPDATLRGSASLLLQAAAYYDPSLQNVRVDPRTGQLTAGAPPGTTGTTPEA